MALGVLLMLGSCYILQRSAAPRHSASGVAWAWFAVGTGASGVACALTILPSLPEMQLGLAPDDEAAKTRVVAVWNAMLALGATAGAQSGAALYTSFGFGAVCVAMMSVCGVAVVVVVVGLCAGLGGRAGRGGGAAVRAMRAGRGDDPLATPLNS